MSDNAHRSHVDWLHEHAVRSATPDAGPAHERRTVRDVAYTVDREPQKRGLPPTPPPEPAKVERPDMRAFPPAAIETYVRVTKLGLDMQGVPPCLIGHMPGPTSKAAVADWHYRPMPITAGGVLIMSAQQDTPVHCAGAAFRDTPDFKRHMRVIGEAEAGRVYRDAALQAVGAMAISPAKVARGKWRRGL